LITKERERGRNTGERLLGIVSERELSQSSSREKRKGVRGEFHQERCWKDIGKDRARRLDFKAGHRKQFFGAILRMRRDEETKKEKVEWLEKQRAIRRKAGTRDGKDISKNESLAKLDGSEKKRRALSGEKKIERIKQGENGRPALSHSKAKNLKPRAGELAGLSLGKSGGKGFDVLPENTFMKSRNDHGRRKST